MRPIKYVTAPPAVDLAQRYRTLAAQGQIRDALTDAENGLAELLSLQNTALSRVERLVRQANAGAAARDASADEAQPLLRAESFRNDMAQCGSSPNGETASATRPGTRTPPATTHRPRPRP